ncbi:TetR/AcrR family transcriptional regulator [Agromyces sp. MMS24-JH15]|uniref:TetR/AcrR family transcriptional regulator n=1 Tax=Agromyces sp. MMS24-JH15 TaxID=3243765 RepID=UPI0037487F52
MSTTESTESAGPTARRADARRNRELALAAATSLLGEPGAPLTVDTIAKRAGLGAGTIARAFGGKDPLIDAAVAGLLGPVVDRAEALGREPEPAVALRTFLTELVAFQSAHSAVGAELAGLDLPTTTGLRARLVAAVVRLVDRARASGAIRADITAETAADLLIRTAHAVIRSPGSSPELSGAFVAVLMDGLRPAAPVLPRA